MAVIKVGDRVRVNNSHPHRGGQYGAIVEPDVDGPLLFESLNTRYCVRFDNLGAGIHGRYLFLDDKDFTLE